MLKISVCWECEAQSGDPNRRQETDESSGTVGELATSYFWLKPFICVRFGDFTPVTMKNAVFWDIKTQFVPHRRHITSLLQSPSGYCYVRFEVFTAVTMKNAVFWGIKTQFVPHRKHITSLLQSPTG
jgi:hypothetical protein